MKRMAISLLMLIPMDGEIERSDCMDALQAWHETRYDMFNEAEDLLVKNGLIVRMGHGSGYTYRLGIQGGIARGVIDKMLGL